MTLSSSPPLSFLQPVSAVAANVAAINVKNVVFIAKFFVLLYFHFNFGTKVVLFIEKCKSLRNKEVSFFVMNVTNYFKLLIINI